MKKTMGQADRVRQLQLVNVNALFEFEKKQADDESKAALAFFKARLIDDSLTELARQHQGAAKPMSSDGPTIFVRCER